MKPIHPAIISLAALLTASTCMAGVRQRSPLDSIGIVVTGASREFSFTNKESAFLYGETNGPNTMSGQGFNVFGREFLDDYIVTVDNRELSRSSAVTTVFPDFLRRDYPGGVREEVRPVDSLAAFAITLSSGGATEIGFSPLFADLRSVDDAMVILSDATASIARKNHLVRSETENYPAWITVHAPGCTPIRRPFRRGGQFSPVTLASPRRRSLTILVAVGDRRTDAERDARSLSAILPRYAADRRRRMELLLAATETRTGNPRFDAALRWAKISMDALLMNQGTHGIFAGLPWFNNYWGRDSFIALPGAALVTGRFDEARRILRSFARFQQCDSSSSDYGRIPNLVTTTDTAYNTADGTPRFVMMVLEYVRRSGDTRFILEMYPTIVRSIDGTLRYHSDSLGFLTHGDAETWMDAVGPDGPWSPRGNRAVDVQALWIRQLETGIACATRLGDVASALRWNSRLALVRESFRRMFIRPEGIPDRLASDGKPDMQMRPNQIFAASLLPDSVLTHVVETVTSRLMYDYGVASLAQDEPNFHPYHQHPLFYPKDAAYHNGTVWTWLQGAVISELCRHDRENLAYAVTQNSVHQILDRGGVGTQSELLDALPRPGQSEPRLSGTFSQAWNLAEFIRNFYDDYLGIRIERESRIATWAPRIPDSLTSIDGRINVGSGGVHLHAAGHGSKQTLRISSSEYTDSLHVRFSLRLAPGNTCEVESLLPPHSVLELRITDGTPVVICNGASSPWVEPPHRTPPLPPLARNLALARPSLRPGLRSLTGPGYPLLGHDEIIRINPGASPVFEADDRLEDDTGTGQYVYPGSPQFVPGSFDLRRLAVTCDSHWVYFSLAFRALSNPGWHPEYGFQLTFAAIAIDQDGTPGSGAIAVGRNALASVAREHAYERIIFVGGGIRVEDALGKVLAAYIPVESDAADPFGNAATGTIQFALPVAIIGTPTDRWTCTVLAGAQDDHGGSGLGEFRTVNRERGEWNGGGKRRPDDTNVYDTMIVRRGTND